MFGVDEEEEVGGGEETTMFEAEEVDDKDADDNDDSDEFVEEPKAEVSLVIVRTLGVFEVLDEDKREEGPPEVVEEAVDEIGRAEAAAAGVPNPTSPIPAICAAEAIEAETSGDMVAAF